MVHGRDGGQVYLCHMHSQVRQTGPGSCRNAAWICCPESTRFGMLRHMIKSPMMLTIMAAVMVGERDSFDRAA